MEVHQHSHTPRTKWKHYVWEFFMLFLAVFCGYLAEWKLEHRIEKQREKKFMQSLLKDLQTDMDSLKTYTLKKERKLVQCDSLINQLLSAPHDNASKIYLWGRLATRRHHFYPQDGSLRQLDNSGGFRVIHDQNILDSINSYQLLIKQNKENIEVEEKELTEYGQFASKLFSAAVFQSMTASGQVQEPGGSPALMSYDPFLLNELCNKLHYWKRTALTTLQNYNLMEQKATSLSALIKHEYHLSESSARTPSDTH
ncbi:MAG TPA: hypothetical protein VF476_02595 [Chitinophagaceae bacterium]